MMHEPDELYEAAITLSKAERAVLVMRLLDSMDGAANIAHSQSKESTSRLAAMQSGELSTLDNEEALRLISG